MLVFFIKRLKSLFPIKTDIKFKITDLKQTQILPKNRLKTDPMAKKIYQKSYNIFFLIFVILWFCVRYCNCVKNYLYLKFKWPRHILCCGNKLNFIEAKTIQYSSLSPIKCPNWNKNRYFFTKKTQNRPKMGKRSVKQTYIC